MCECVRALFLRQNALPPRQVSGGDPEALLAVLRTGVFDILHGARLPWTPQCHGRRGCGDLDFCDVGVLLQHMRGLLLLPVS